MAKRAQLVVVTLMTAAGPFPAGARADADDAKAREVAGKFLRALQAKDATGMAEVTGVPWLAGGEQVVTDRAQLTKALARQAADSDRVTAGLAVHEEVVRYVGPGSAQGHGPRGLGQGDGGRRPGRLCR
jgi:hypothetical protein